MNLFVASLLAALAGARSQCISQNDAMAPPASPDLTPLNDFGINLFRKVVSPSKNFIFSPFSVWSALTLTYFGSNGNTKSQMEQVLRLTNREDVLATFKAVENIYTSRNNNYTIDTANRIYATETLTLKDCLQQVFSDKLKMLNFSNVDLVVETVNQFVSTTTRGKITSIVTPDIVKETAMILVNAIYFKGFWKRKFEAKDTIQRKFFISANEHVMVDMMHQYGEFKYGFSNELDAQVLEMPYRGNGASMYVFLPKDKKTGQELDDMLGRLNPDSLAAALRQLVYEDVVVRFPKFKFDSSVDDELKKALKALGITDLFSGASDLSNFAPRDKIAVSRVIHKAVIEVDEEGAEAAAVTAVIGAVIVSIQPPSPPVNFFCERPFFFAIVDTKLNNILFMGTFRKP